MDVKTSHHKSIYIPLFDIHEDGFHLGLKNAINFKRWKDSPNLLIQSEIETSRKAVSISVKVDGVFV